MNLHGKIMNLQCGDLAFGGLDRNYINAHKLGHRDARHAAAELAIKADACIEVLRALDTRLRECANIPASAADAYGTFWQSEVSEALESLRFELVGPNVGNQPARRVRLIGLVRAVAEASLCLSLAAPGDLENE